MSERPPPCRLPDWRPRLVAWLATVRDRAFAYGSHDCALFVAGAVEAMTGDDPGAGFRGRYATVKGGLKAVLKAGASDHEDVFRQRFAAIPPAFAAIGDIAVLPMPDGIPALGIFEGGHIVVLRETGLGLYPREAATSAYRVP